MQLQSRKPTLKTKRPPGNPSLTATRVGEKLIKNIQVSRHNAEILRRTNKSIKMKTNRQNEQRERTGFYKENGWIKKS